MFIPSISSHVMPTRSTRKLSNCEIKIHKENLMEALKQCDQSKLVWVKIFSSEKKCLIILLEKSLHTVTRQRSSSDWAGQDALDIKPTVYSNEDQNKVYNQRQ